MSIQTERSFSAGEASRTSSRVPCAQGLDDFGAGEAARQCLRFNFRQVTQRWTKADMHDGRALVGHKVGLHRAVDDFLSLLVLEAIELLQQFFILRVLCDAQFGRFGELCLEGFFAPPTVRRCRKKFAARIDRPR